MKRNTSSKDTLIFIAIDNAWFLDVLLVIDEVKHVITVMTRNNHMHPPTEEAHSLCLLFTVLETYFLASSSSFSLASFKAQAQARLLNLRPPRERGLAGCNGRRRRAKRLAGGGPSLVLGVV